MRERRGTILALMVLSIALLATAGLAQETDAGETYRLGSGDILQLNVVQQPDLDRTLTIRPDGSAVIPRIGPVTIGGLTLVEAEELIRQRLRLYDPGINEVSLTVMEYNALRIFVLGAVTSPGAYSFTSPPTLWAAIRAAGGPTSAANLSVTRVVHQQETGARTEIFDLSALLTGQGELPEVQLKPGDTVIVPTSEGLSRVPSEVGVQVFGAVGSPSTVAIAEPTRLITVLMQAGTPHTTAALDKVWWVHREDVGRFRSTQVNLRLYLEEGSLAGNPLVYPGDTIRVPVQGPSWFGRFWPALLGTVGTTVAILYAIDRIKSN
jgi:polysaccharide export outer membrane protein